MVTILTKPLSNWLRIPTWGILAALAVAVLLASHSAAMQDARLAQAIDDGRAFLKGSKAFHGAISALAEREVAALRVASSATALLGRQTQAGVDLRNRADSLRKASLATAKTAQDTISVLTQQVDTLHASNDSLGRALVSGVKAIDSLGSAVRLADQARNKAVKRADSAEMRIRELVRAESCHILWVLPCVRNVHVGPSFNQNLVPNQQRAFGVSVVWSP